MKFNSPLRRMDGLLSLSAQDFILILLIMAFGSTARPGQEKRRPRHPIEHHGHAPEGALTLEWLFFPGFVSVDDGQTVKTGAGNSLDVSQFAGKDVTLS